MRPDECPNVSIHSGSDHRKTGRYERMSPALSSEVDRICHGPGEAGKRTSMPGGPPTTSISLGCLRGPIGPAGDRSDAPTHRPPMLDTTQPRRRDHSGWDSGLRRKALGENGSSRENGLPIRGWGDPPPGPEKGRGKPSTKSRDRGPVTPLGVAVPSRPSPAARIARGRRTTSCPAIPSGRS